MKKRKNFDIREWQRNKTEKHEMWCQHWRVIITHPLTFIIIMIAIAYIFEL